MKIIPAFILRRIAQRPELINIAFNIGWLFFDKVLRMGVGLIIGVWVARYLGSAQFGLLNFAIAFTGLFSAIATLGLQSIVVRDIVRDPENASLTLGTTAMLQLLSGSLSFILILVAIAYLRPDDLIARNIVSIFGAMMLLKASEIAVYCFESKVQSKYIVWVQNSVFLIFAALKVGLILLDAPLMAFAWVMLAEVAVVAATLLLVLDLYGHPIKQLQFSMGRAITLVKDSWPLALSGVAITIYMKIDQIMLAQMIGNEAVGIYSAAVRISEVWYFIPMAIVASVLPAIIDSKKRCNEEYYLRIQKLFDLMVVLSVCLAIAMTFIATPLVILLYGPDFSDAGTILSIHIWAGVFVFLGVASSGWFLNENLQKIALQRTVCGAVSNVILNLVLIPKFGLQGAALALLVSQAIASFLFDGIQGVTRRLFLMKIRAMNPARWYRVLAEVRRF